jgi:hypothetical protein
VFYVVKNKLIICFTNPFICFKNIWNIPYNILQFSKCLHVHGQILKNLPIFPDLSSFKRAWKKKWKWLRPEWKRRTFLFHIKIWILNMKNQNLRVNKIIWTTMLLKLKIWNPKYVNVSAISEGAHPLFKISGSATDTTSLHEEFNYVGNWFSFLSIRIPQNMSNRLPLSYMVPLEYVISPINHAQKSFYNVRNWLVGKSHILERLLVWTYSG